MNKALLFRTGLSVLNKNVVRQGASSYNFRFNNCNRIITSRSSCKLHYSTCFQPSLLKSTFYVPSVNLIRWKKKKSSAIAVIKICQRMCVTKCLNFIIYILQADEVESDDEVEEDFKTEDGTKATKVVVSSLRVDVVLKSCLGLARK
jgi:hypothetical protein